MEPERLNPGLREPVNLGNLQNSCELNGSKRSSKGRDIWMGIPPGDLLPLLLIVKNFTNSFEFSLPLTSAVSKPTYTPFTLWTRTTFQKLPIECMVA